MLNFQGSPYHYRDGISRRDILKVGALGLGGLTLADLLRLQAQGAAQPKSSVKSIIMVYLHGGPSHIDMFDMKPDAPAEVRGEFKPISTNLPGLNICELMPELAKVADKMTLIRNMCFLEFDNAHDPVLVYTGFHFRPIVRPTFGSIVSKLRGGAVREVPPYVAFDDPWTPRLSTDFLGLAHHPFIPPVNDATAALVGGAHAALRMLEAHGCHLILAGHLHQAYSGDVRPHHVEIKRSILVIQAGTAISYRRRDEMNAYNVLTVDGPTLSLEVRTWNGEEFTGAPPQRFTQTENGWSAK